MKKILIFLGVAYLSILLITGVAVAANGQSKCSENYRADALVRYQELFWNTQVADNEQTREQGLSDRTCLGNNQGMLFAFDAPSATCFWMQDMNFDLDMIWLNESKEVVDVMYGATPDSFPAQFCPEEEAKYVLEVNAGQAEAAGIVPGVKLNF